MQSVGELIPASLFLFNQLGDPERAMLRCGDHSSPKFWRRVPLSAIERYRRRDIPKHFRGDAAFAIPVLYRVLEEQSFQYTICFPANKVLMASIRHRLTHPLERPSHKPKVF